MEIDGTTVGIDKFRIGAVGKAKELAPYVGFAYGTASKTGTWADEWEIQKRLYEQAQQNTNKPKSGSKSKAGSKSGKSKPNFSKPPR